jgi:hypothetical protein
MTDNIRIEGDMITFRGEPMATIIRNTGTLRDNFEHTITTSICDDSFQRGWADGHREGYNEGLLEAEDA